MSALQTQQTRAGYGQDNLVHVWRIPYVAHTGVAREAYVVLPRWYGPADDPTIPLIISPHGRGISARANARRWGNLPALGSFAVVCPDGQGRRFKLFAWGDPGDISDLARMPNIVREALPFVHIEPRRIYAFGSSMGGQETLLLLAQYPHLLAGAAAFDADTNLATRYRMVRFLRYGSLLQSMLRDEVGGTPATNPVGYMLRSPIAYAHRIADSGVPLQIWWSRTDRIVRKKDDSCVLFRAERLTVEVSFGGRWLRAARVRKTDRHPQLPQLERRRHQCVSALFPAPEAWRRSSPRLRPWPDRPSRLSRPRSSP